MYTLHKGKLPHRRTDGRVGIHAQNPTVLGGGVTVAQLNKKQL